MTPPEQRAADAIRYVLDRAAHEQQGLGRYLEPFTEAWAQLVDAEAALLGHDVNAHRAARRRLAFGDEP